MPYWNHTFDTPAIGLKIASAANRKATEFLINAFAPVTGVAPLSFAQRPPSSGFRATFSAASVLVTSGGSEAHGVAAEIASNVSYGTLTCRFASSTQSRMQSAVAT